MRVVAVVMGNLPSNEISYLERGLPMGLKKRCKIPEGRGEASDFGIQTARGDEHFGIFEGKGG